MTGGEALAMYHPIRASGATHFELDDLRLQSIGLHASRQTARALGRRDDISAGGRSSRRDAQRHSAFEPNQRGRRAFGTFLGGKALQIDAPDVEMARRMGDAFFSLFRFTARHEVAGVWLEDLLADNRKLWLMDESMESSTSTSGAFGMRVFDAAKFHVGFGVAVPSDDETTEFTVQSMTRNGRTPFRQSLAVTLYGDSLREHTLRAQSPKTVSRCSLR